MEKLTNTPEVATEEGKSNKNKYPETTQFALHLTYSLVGVF